MISPHFPSRMTGPIHWSVPGIQGQHPKCEIGKLTADQLLVQMTQQPNSYSDSKHHYGGGTRGGEGVSTGEVENMFP